MPSKKGADMGVIRYGPNGKEQMRDPLEVKEIEKASGRRNS